MTLGRHKAAVLLSPDSSLQVQLLNTPRPRSHQLLIRVKAVAINPSDWKMQETKKSSEVPCILGSDIAGIVVERGPDCSQGFNLDDRVAAFAGGAWSNRLEEGGFQEYVLVSECNTFPLPEHINFVEAAVLPMALTTAASAIWHTLQIPRPRFPNVATPCNQAIVVYGASSSVGLLATQMANSIGYKAIAIASERHKEYVKKMGASHFLDRSAPNIAEKIAEIVTEQGLELRVGLDAISRNDTIIAAAQMLSRCARGKTTKLAVTLALPETIAIPSNVEVERTSASHFHKDEDNARWLLHKYMSWAMSNDLVKPAPPARVIEGSLDAIQSAIEICKTGVSCEKLVIKL